MKSLEADELLKHAPPYEPGDVDPEFIPYLERINAKPFVASIQCCIGHCPYGSSVEAPANATAYWGYSQLLMTGPSAVWLSQQVHGSSWLVLSHSQLWPDKHGKKASKMPVYTNKCNFIVAFAWDASAWPTPAIEICSLIDRYNDAKPDEPARLVHFELPKGKNRPKRPPPTGPKKK